MEACCYQYIRETVKATAPDLIIIVGDCVYGEWEQDETVLKISEKGEIEELYNYLCDAQFERI